MYKSNYSWQNERERFEVASTCFKQGTVKGNKISKGNWYFNMCNVYRRENEGKGKAEKKAVGCDRKHVYGTCKWRGCRLSSRVADPK